MMTRGQYLRRVRTDRNISYEDMAEIMGVHPITVRNWEKRGCKALVMYAYRWRFRSVKPRKPMVNMGEVV